MASLSIWAETAIFSLLFLAVFGVIVGSMNLSYSKNYNSGFGDSQNTTQLLVTYGNTSQQKISGGEVNFNSINGITLKTSWDLILDLLNIVWAFISGGFIYNIIMALQLGATGQLLAVALQTVFVISLISAILYTLFRVQT